MAEPIWSQRGPVDRWGRPIMPRPHWVGETEPELPITPSPPVTPPPPIPPLVPPVNRYTVFRAPLDCGEAAYLAEHVRIGSPLSTEDIRACYRVVPEWASQMLATGVKETELGKTARGSHNFLNLFVADGSGPADFASWADCAKAWKHRISEPTYKNGVYQPTSASIEQIIATYQGGRSCWDTKGQTCAHGETWEPCEAGSIELSIQQFCARVNTYMGRMQKVPWGPVPGGAGCKKPETPPGQPVIYTLDRDYANFGLTKQEARTLQGQCFRARSGQGVLAAFVHVQEGTTPGSLSWWLTQGIQASSTVMIQQDGSILQVIPEKDGPWTNGDTCNPTVKGRGFLDQCKGGNPNLFTLSIENEGYFNKPHSNEQLDANVWQLKTWSVKYGLDLPNAEDLYPHASVNQCSRPNCCGSVLWDGILARL